MERQLTYEKITAFSKANFPPFANANKNVIKTLNLKPGSMHLGLHVLNSVFSFSLPSWWQSSPWKGQYALCLVSQQSSQDCNWKSIDARMLENRSLQTLEGGILTSSCLHFSLHVIHAVMVWFIHVDKIPQSLRAYQGFPTRMVYLYNDI